MVAAVFDRLPFMGTLEHLLSHGHDAVDLVALMEKIDEFEKSQSSQ